MEVRPRRAALVLGALTLALGGLLGRTAFLQSAGATAAEYAERQHDATATLAARRGSIFDARGQLLAANVTAQDAFVDPKFFLEQNPDPADRDAAIDALAEILLVDPLTLAQKIGRRPDARFVVIAEHLAEDQRRAIADIGIKGIGLSDSPRRLYPAGSLAAHVLGSVGSDGNGLEGIELARDGTLHGTPGKTRQVLDARRRPLLLAAADLTPPHHGRHLVLTLDANIQRIVEEELAATCREHNAKTGQAVVMDPRTGDIVALAVWPSYDPSAPGDVQTDLRRNRAIVDPYEPGSVLKPFIVAAAIDDGLTTPAEVWPINGATWRTSYGRTITDVYGYHNLNTWDVVVKSSNVGMSMLGNRMGNDGLHDALGDFGFGQRGGLGLPGEGAGMVLPLRRWTKYSTESISQGYEMLATPLQLVRAVSAIANNGWLPTPRVVKGTLDENGGLMPEPSKPMRQAVSPEAAAWLRRIMADVPVRGTGKKARSDTYHFFGKTGTAHQAVDGKYDEEHYAASFVGGGPYEAPRLTIALVVHEPDKSVAHFGGIVAAPTAGRILERSLAYLEVPPSQELPEYPADVKRQLHGMRSQ
ncbi:MAG: penicillin-binding protein 2 [Planctomycetota bacterium]